MSDLPVMDTEIKGMHLCMSVMVNARNVWTCGKAEVGRGPGNGKLPLETFRLVGANITKH